MGTLREECGVFGIFAQNTYALQHRGQESCGIVVNDDGLFRTHRDLGLVNDVFDHAAMELLGQGNMAVGHVRYGTTGATDRYNTQPIVVNHSKGRMALAHNGNIVNSLTKPCFLEHPA